MAYMSQERKAKIAANLKPVLAKYGIKATLAVRHHSTLVLNISAGPIDFIGNFNAKLANDPYRKMLNGGPAKDHLCIGNGYDRWFDGDVVAFCDELWPLLHDGNWDRSDIQTDYFDVGWYVDVNVGSWNKPYVYTGGQQAAA